MFDAFYTFINVPCLAAGFLGGLARVFKKDLEKASARDVIGYLVIGALAANFIAPQVLNMFPLGLVAFGVGYCGKRLCAAMEMFFNKLDVFGKTKNE